ncbi:MAG: response regulator [Nitrospirae bacterium]|jgi:CheY-like chemotaxis protein|nr:response regulator [Nitrospirota bacterium]MDA8215766.1 response regulator [Nitrospiraceae bacterium]MDA8340221.1 response regulator [Nitrospiraceae bacterium]
MERTKKKILVVDDDERHLVTAKELLEDAGYEVITHYNWFGSTNVIKRLQPDLILLDINMPALSGDALSEILRGNSRTKDVPIVFYSSNDEDSLRKAVSECGVRGYICKGDVFDLRKKVAAYMSQSRENQSHQNLTLP